MGQAFGSQGWRRRGRGNSHCLDASSDGEMFPPKRLTHPGQSWDDLTCRNLQLLTFTLHRGAQCPPCHPFPTAPRSPISPWGPEHPRAGMSFTASRGTQATHTSKAQESFETLSTGREDSPQPPSEASIALSCRASGHRGKQPPREGRARRGPRPQQLPPWLRCSGYGKNHRPPTAGHSAWGPQQGPGSVPSPQACPLGLSLCSEIHEPPVRG